MFQDNSHEISFLIFSKTGKDVANLSSAAVVIGALRVKKPYCHKISGFSPVINPTNLYNTTSDGAPCALKSPLFHIYNNVY